MSDEEFDAKFDQLMWRADNVHSTEDLQKLLEVQQKKEWDYYELPLWRWIVIEDYSKDSSYAIITMNHCLTDGINLSAVLKMLSDGNDTRTTRIIRGIDNVSPLLRPFINVFYAAKIGLYLLTRSKANNPMKKTGLPKKEDRLMYLLDPYDN